jgi:hypothetical protein
VPTYARAHRAAGESDRDLNAKGDCYAFTNATAYVNSRPNRD